MRITLIFTILAALGFACGQSAETSDNAEVTSVPATPNEEDADRFQNTETTALLEDYVELKNALVESDAAAAATAAEAMAVHEEAPQGLLTAAKAIAETDDITIQRDQFYTLSNLMYGLVKNDPRIEQTVYWQYCPMARDNQGANWLSMESEILNPYFGDAMLNCGAVEEEL